MCRTQDAKGWKKSIEEKEICMCWANKSLKMTYLTNLCLRFTLQAIEDLVNPKSCELPTLVENGMPSKPMES